MTYIDFIEKIHKKTRRDYLGERVIGVNKAECAKVAKKFDIKIVSQFILKFQIKTFTVFNNSGEVFQKRFATGICDL